MTRKPTSAEAMIAVAFCDDRQPLVTDPYDWAEEEDEDGQEHG